MLRRLWFQRDSGLGREASMSKIAASVVGLLLWPVIAKAQQEAELNVGWLNYSAGTISQDLSVQNNGFASDKSRQNRMQLLSFFQALFRAARIWHR